MSTLQTWKCECCRNGEFTGTAHDLVKEGWMRKGNPGRMVLICGDCLERLAPIWARQDKKAKAVKK